ncbi:protein RESISTANCE TO PHYTOPHTHORA 1, chloroplastic [Salvia hispanica]|uniref:protein RESISTANCE TO PHYTOPHTHORA 1, chloroplastic n=1 Tax=Salvia hispanica TaxID=49212 RepID=UPI0020095776|nr:protein RESISTANCE TO PHYTOPHTHORA 1, chloroplastic [Salvia hispanica]
MFVRFQVESLSHLTGIIINMSALTSSSLFNSHISRLPSSFSNPTSYSIRIGFPIKIPRIRASSNELDIKTDQKSEEDVQEPDNDQGIENGSNNSSGTTSALDKDLKKVVQKTAATFAPRASTASKNPAVPGTVLYTVFEVQGYASLLLGGALSFNLIFPSNEPDLWRLMGMWSIWMFTIPSLRARDCSKNEKEALNYLFLLVPLLNVTIPFFLKSFAVVWSADVVAFFGMYAWKLGWFSQRE